MKICPITADKVPEEPLLLWSSSVQLTCSTSPASALPSVIPRSRPQAGHVLQVHVWAHFALGNLGMKSHPKASCFATTKTGSESNTPGVILYILAVFSRISVFRWRHQWASVSVEVVCWSWAFWSRLLLGHLWWWPIFSSQGGKELFFTFWIVSVHF